MGNTVKAIGNTVGDAGNAMGNGIVGGMFKAMPHPMMKQMGDQHLKKAKQQVSGALIGEVDVNADIHVNISNPYNMTLSAVNTKFKITRGIGGLMVQPILCLVKTDLQNIASAVIKVYFYITTCEVVNLCTYDFKIHIV